MRNETPWTARLQTRSGTSVPDLRSTRVRKAGLETGRGTGVPPSRLRKSAFILSTLLLASLAFAQPPGRGRGAPAGPFTRLGDGKANLQGYWESRNFATAFDVEDHPKEEFGIPAGKGVVVDPADGKIPYQQWAKEKRQDILEHHLFDDPQAHCWLSGVPRQMYTPFGFQILQPEGSVILLYEAFHSFRIIPLDNKP